MRWSRTLVLTVVFILLDASSGHAIVGCLVDVKDLVPRAAIIVTGRIEGVQKVETKTCTERKTGDDLSKPLKCGEVYALHVSVSERLRGTSATRVDILIPNVILEVSCDDRPAVKDMKGLYVTLFLESADGFLWTLDGPNSIYTFHRKPDPKFIRMLKAEITKSRQP